LLRNVVLVFFVNVFFFFLFDIHLVAAFLVVILNLSFLFCRFFLKY
jgi:hypothetical protein